MNPIPEYVEEFFVNNKPFCLFLSIKSREKSSNFNIFRLVTFTNVIKPSVKFVYNNNSLSLVMLFKE